MLNPDLLFVLNQRNRPTFTPAELDRSIRLITVDKVATASAEIAIANRPDLSPAELRIMNKAGILPVGNPLRDPAGLELADGSRVRYNGRRRSRSRRR